jgi:NAD(P)H dehydrogenase (quinone)
MTQTIKHAIIACHPLKKSFTMAVAHRYAETVAGHGHEVVIRDLYRTGFNPVLKAKERRGRPAADVAREWAALGKPDVFVLVYPIWFGTPPAMLKGYIDRVFGAGRSRGQGGEGGSRELLAGKRLVSLTSSGSLDAWLAEKGVLGSLRTIFCRYLADVFGFAETHFYHFDGVTAELPEREVRMHLAAAEAAAREVMSRMVPGAPPLNPNPR